MLSYKFLSRKSYTPIKTITGNEMQNYEVRPSEFRKVELQDSAGLAGCCCKSTFIPPFLEWGGVFNIFHVYTRAIPGLY
jgi:hypothetical protein